MRLLSTKIVEPLFIDRLVQNGCSVVEYPFIKIESIATEVISLNKYLIFTSQNGVRIAFNDPKIKIKIALKKCFCVGEKTKSLLEENGLKVIKMSQNASNLEAKEDRN
jgi:uroporphyrinogen-III synthase